MSLLMVKEGAINYYARTTEQFQQNRACDNNLYSLFQLWNAIIILYTLKPENGYRLFC